MRILRGMVGSGRQILEVEARVRAEVRTHVGVSVRLDAQVVVKEGAVVAEKNMLEKATR